MCAGWRRPSVDFTEPPGGEQVPAESLYSVKGNEVFEGAKWGGGCPGADVHLANTEDEDDETAEEEKDCANSTSSNGEPGP